VLIHDHNGRKVHSLALGPLRTNCFIVEHVSSAFLIDPVGDPEVIEAYLNDHNISIDFCMATHGHYDHVGAAAHLIRNGHCNELYLHREDKIELRRCNTYSRLLHRRSIELPPMENICWFSDDFKTLLGKRDFQIEHLPGHTAGSTIVFSDDRRILFSGDTVLKKGKDRNNRCKVGESKEGLANALQHIASTFSGDTLVFPGHGRMMSLDSFDVMHLALQEA
jgi:hydroxyacylglutathione hydrolase